MRGWRTLDWSRVKTILIVVFLLINVFLITKIISRNNDQYIKAEEIKNVKELLLVNRIKLNTPIPSRIKSMKRLIMNYESVKLSMDEIKKNQKQYQLVSSYYYKGNQIFNVEAKVINSEKIVVNENLAAVIGLTGDSQKVNPIDAIIEFVRVSVGKEFTINKISLGYYINVNGGSEIAKYEKVTANPAWKIETDKGIYYFDGYTGKIL
jgi:hypothetical protein